MRSIALNAICVLVSLATALAVCEAGLRLFHPRYHHAVRAQSVPDEQRIWKPLGYSHSFMLHPDTGLLHRVMHNNLGARQHRDFDQESLDGAVNLAFFGDSVTANVRLPVQYSFHAVLDFLLNANSPSSESVPRRFNVLNFGVDGYGPGQQYRQYQGLPPKVKAAVDHVFYLFTSNDFDDVYRHGIYSLDNAGNLVERLPAQTPGWKKAIAGLHLTYAVMDGAVRLRREWAERFPADQKTLGQGHSPALRGVDPEYRLWQAVVLRWQRAVESAGASFTVLAAPAAAMPESVEMFRLRDCQRAHLPHPPPRHMLRFEYDSHWNEGGNMLAAHCLYRFVAKRLGLPPASDEVLSRQRDVYYRAFLQAPEWLGGRWLPEPPWALPGTVSASAGRAIVERYLALEASERSSDQWDDHWAPVVEAAKAEGVLARAAWDVYAAWDERLMVYVKAPCRDEDLEPTFFLRVWPERNDADSARAVPFFGNDMSFVIRRTTDECVVGAHLPDAAFSKARVGQFVRPVEEGRVIGERRNVWAVDLPLREYPD